MNKKKFYSGLILLSSLLLIFICFQDFSTVDMSNPLAPFSKEHLLGTDTFGRDILSRLSLGALISISLSFVITALSTFFGVILAFLMAERGILSSLSWGFSDTLKSLSSIILALFLSTIFGPHFLIVIISISLSHIPNIARTMYSRIIVVKNEEFVLYARSEGMGEAEIALKHIFPHAKDELVAQSISIFSSSILTESALSFLGAGIPILYPSLGSMLSDSRALLLTHPSLVIIPALTLFLISLSLHLISEAFS